MDNLITTDADTRQLALLYFDNIIIALPQSEIVFVENLSQVYEQRLNEHSSGKIHYNSSDLPVYTLNHELEFIHKLAADNRICAIIKSSDNEIFALMCNALEKHNVEDNTAQSSIPQIMRNQKSPVTGFLKIADKLTLVCSAESLGSYFKLSETVPQQELKHA